MSADQETVANQTSEYGTLSRSQQNYLCVIYFIIRKKKVARSKEIASFLGVSYASVTGALRSLAKQDLVFYEPYSLVELTEKGKKFARDLVHRQRVLFEFFVDLLQLPEDEACELIIRAQELMGMKVIQGLQRLNKRHTEGADENPRVREDELFKNCENLCRMCHMRMDKIT